MARTFGTLFSLGGISGYLILAVGDQTDRNDPVIAMLATLALVLGAVCFVGYGRLPVAFFEGLTLVGTAIIAGAVASASSGAEGVYALYYVWTIFLAFFFVPFRRAAFQAAFAAATYGLVLELRGTEFGINYWISAVATLGTTGAMMGLMRARVEQVAANHASEARTDAVTRIANRRHFDERFDLEIARAEGGRPLSLVICDLDRFKAVNDELGHEEGDAALRLVASRIAGSIRRGDTVSRLGGEEFGVLLPDADEAEALKIAQRIRISVSEAFQDHEVPVTASCGLATVSDGLGHEQLMAAADAALYQAKRDGRDRVVAYDGSIGLVAAEQ